MGLFSRKSEFKEERSLGDGAIFADSLFYCPSTSYITSSAMKISPVHRAVNLISRSCGILPISLYQKTEDGKHTIDNDLIWIVNNEPNEVQTRYTFFKQIMQDVLLTGNGYGLIMREGTKVKEIRYIKPSYVVIKWNEADYKVSYDIKGYGVKQSYEVLHFFSESDDGIQGKSILKSAGDTLELAADSNRTARKFFKNGMGISGILKFKNLLNDKQRNEIRTAWSTSMSTGDGGIAILGNDADFQSVSLDPKNSQLLESRQFNVAEIARFFDMNPCMLGTDSNYNQIEAAMIGFLQECLQPVLTMIEQELNRKLLLRRERMQGYYFSFDTSDLLRCTKKDLSEWMTKLVSNGLATPNELREKLDLKPMDGGDECYMQTAMSPINNIVKNTENERDTQE